MNGHQGLNILKHLQTSMACSGTGTGDSLLKLPLRIWKSKVQTEMNGGHAARVVIDELSFPWLFTTIYIRCGIPPDPPLIREKGHEKQSRRPAPNRSSRLRIIRAAQPLRQ
jgi:hypothetical protein